MADPIYTTDEGAEQAMPGPGYVADDQEPEEEAGAPERIAPEDEHPLESPEALRQPREESGEEGVSGKATPDRAESGSS